MGLIHKDGTEGEHSPHNPEENASNFGKSVGWVTDLYAVAHGWDSDNSSDYVVMSIRQKLVLKSTVIHPKPGSIADHLFLFLP